MSNELKGQPKDESGRGWLQSLPAIIGLSLGGVYALGALNTFGQLYAADVSPTQALAFVSVDQMLARGIASLVSPALYVAGLIALLYGLRMLLEMAFPSAAETEDEPQDRSSPKTRSRVAKAFDTLNRWADKPLVMAGFVVLLLGLSVPPSILLTLFITYLGALTVVWLTRHIDWQRHDHYDGFFFAWMITFSLIGAAVASFLQASPLPDVSLTLRNGGCVNGGLVLDTGDTWYVKKSSDHISAIPARNVKIADVHFLDIPREQNLLGALTGWHPPPILGQFQVRILGTKTPRSFRGNCRGGTHGYV